MAVIHLFNRRELTVVYSNQRLYRLTAVLEAAGIPFQTKFGGGSVFTADRYRGMPGIHSDASHSYKIYVNREDYDRAQSVLQSVQ